MIALCRRSVLIDCGSNGPRAHGAVSTLPAVTIGAIQTHVIRRRLLCQAQHHVGDDAGDRDVEPEWKGPAGKLAVLRKAASDRKEEGDQDQRQRDYGQNNVAAKEQKIKRTIGGKGGITDVSVERVMKDVAHEKEHGEEECRDHRSAVGGNPACTDKGKAED